MSRYDALTESLRSQTGDDVTLSFDDLDEIVGGLPKSARKFAAWWSNGPSAHQSRYWRTAGWRASPDFPNDSVEFQRDGAGTSTSTSSTKAKRKEPTSPRSTPAPAEVRTRRPATLVPNGDTRRATVMYEWLSAGEVGIEKERLSAPLLEGRAGVYRFVITEVGGSRCYYVGESDNLARRMGNYRNPGSSQPTNVRLNARLLKVLADGGSVTVDVVVAALLSGEALDLSHHSARLVIENIELCDLRGRGEVVENL